MGVFDWVSIGLSNKNGTSTGSLEVNIGTSVAATFGSENAHNFGNSFELVFDPMSLIMGGGAGGSAFGRLGMGLLSGIGGNATFVYGGDTYLKYQGPAVDVRRAPSIEKHTDYFLPTLSGIVAERSLGNHAPDPVDQSTFVAIKVLSVLLISVPAAFEIAIRSKYKDDYNPAEYDKLLETLKFCSNTITSRIAGVIRALEIISANAQVGEKLATEFALAAEAASSFLAACIARLTPAEQEVERADEQVTAALMYQLACMRGLAMY